MGFWGRFFGASPPPDVVADVRALPVDVRDAAAHRPETQLALRDTPPPRESPPPERSDIIQPGSQMWRSYPADGVTPESYQVIKRFADSGNTSLLMELFDDVAADYHIGAQLRTRKLAVAGAPVLFESGDGSDAGKTIAASCEKFWWAIPNRMQFVSDVLDDFYRGFSCVRPIWDSIDGKWQIVEHHAVDSRYFYFDNAVTALICETPGSAEGVPVPEGYVYSESRDSPGPIVRAGVGRPVGKLYVYKGYFWVDMAGYLEQFGSPHVQVETARAMREGDPELANIKAAARAFITDQIGIMPAGSTLKVIEAVNKAATVRDVYIAAISFADQCASKAIVGQVLTADAGPGGIGHGGAAEEQGEVRQDLKEADGSRAQDKLTRQVLAPWTRYHFGPKAPVPKFTLVVTKPEDKVQATQAQKNRAETLNILRMFVSLSKAQVRDEFELMAPDGADDTIDVPAPAPPPTQAGDPSGDVLPAVAAQ
jgi:phage gp29-like protein